MSCQGNCLLAIRPLPDQFKADPIVIRQDIGRIDDILYTVVWNERAVVNDAQQTIVDALAAYWFKDAVISPRRHEAKPIRGDTIGGLKPRDVFSRIQNQLIR